MPCTCLLKSWICCQSAVEVLNLGRAGVVRQRHHQLHRERLRQAAHAVVVHRCRDVLRHHDVRLPDDEHDLEADRGGLAVLAVRERVRLVLVQHGVLVGPHHREGDVVDHGAAAGVHRQRLVVADAGRRRPVEREHPGRCGGSVRCLAARHQDQRQHRVVGVRHRAGVRRPDGHRRGAPALGEPSRIQMLERGRQQVGQRSPFGCLDRAVVAPWPPGEGQHDQQHAGDHRRRRLAGPAGRWWRAAPTGPAGAPTG